MSYHIVNIDTPEAYITCRHGQLVCDDGCGKTKQLPLEDVCAIIITSFSSTVHSRLLNEAAKLGVSIIFCENFKPQSILMPANRITDTVLAKSFIEIPRYEIESYWDKTIDAKCYNQLAVASLIAPASQKLENIKIVCQRKTALKESQCARYYWEIFGEGIRREGFSRGDDSFSENKLLDFSYTVLSAIVMQKLFGYGLDASYGISHSVRERSAPLAYDLMEPFRPYIDYCVFRWIEQNALLEDDVCVDRQFKRFLMDGIIRKVPYIGKQIEFKTAIDESIRSFRSAVKRKDITLYNPWTLKNSKWIG